MGYWARPNKFKVQNYIEIPMGAHRVQITDVQVESFSKSKQKCYEITLKVSGHPGRLWYHLWYSPDKPDQTNVNFLAFFKGFQIEEENRVLRRYRKWIGKMGGVYVWHEHGPTKYLNEDEYEARVSHVLDIREYAKLPPWSDAPIEKEKIEALSDVVPAELPF